VRVDRGLLEIAPRAVLRKIGWRLIPFLGILYLLAFLDRVNVGFAALTMNVDLGFSAVVFGSGAGVFFLAYVICGVPSNLMLHRLGARRWIATMMMAWGVASAATAFIRTPMHFYLLRLLLGMAEAGFFPGMILYLTYWFPRQERARILSAFMLALPLSSVVGAPISAALLDLNAFGLRGWQWLFLLEGIPALAAGTITLRYLTDLPDRASWLTPGEKAVLTEVLLIAAPSAGDQGLRRALTHPIIWRLSCAYFALLVALYAYNFWLPQMIQSLAPFSHREIGGLAMLPSAAAALLMYPWGWHSDRSLDRRWHVALPLLLAASGLALAAFVREPAPSMVALTLAAVGIYCSLPVFWSLPTHYLAGAAAAAGIALINTVGNIGGFVGPSVIGYLLQASHDYSEGLLVLAAAAMVSAVLAFHAAGPHP
jgi:MFS transporter, ACS family, tartrate transporter